jgi:phosphoesterase RecJ-like protein
VSGAVAQALERAGRVVVFSHYDPDGDALGASLGLMHLLKLQGKTVWVHSAGPIPEEYGFLPGVELVSQDFPPAGDVDLAVLLDCHQPQRAGQAEAEYLSKVASAAVVDHHQGPVDFGDPAWVDPGYAATSQMLAAMAWEAGWQMSPAAAVCLFTGLQTDTGSFRYSNATPQAFRTAAQLVEAGADPWLVSQEVYATRVKRLRLLARIMDGMSTFADGRLALGQVALSDLAELDADPRDLEEAVEAIRGVPGVQVAALLRELKHGGVKISMRSRGEVDVAAVAISLGGGGHKSAAGLRLEKPLAQAKELITGRLLQAMEAAA